MSHMLHVTNIKLKGTLPNTPCVIYFWKCYAKFSAMVMIKKSHVTYVTCPMSHMLHVTNIKLQRILPKTQCVIYFWKGHAMSSSMAMMKTLHVTCEIALQLKKEIKRTNTKSTPKGPIGIRFAEFFLNIYEYNSV